jgi:uncharacterized coiled-coil protein SlyX
VPYGEVYQLLGGGIAGVLGVACIVLWFWGKSQANERLKEHKDVIAEQKQIIKDLTQALKENAVAIDRQTDLMQSWMPNRQVTGARGR